MNLPRINTAIFDRVKFLDKLLFTKHLALMLKSGITLSEAIVVLESQTKSQVFKGALSRILKGVENGQPLSKSLGQEHGLFDPLYLSIIGIGEESGNLETNLEFLGESMAKTYAFRKKIQGALLYPIIVVLAAVVSGAVMAFYVLPKLVELFNSLDVKLPLSTKILLWIGTTLRDYGAIILPVGLVIIVVTAFLIRTPRVRPKWDRFVLSLPVFGQFMQDIQVASFCRNLGIMLKSGVPITTAIKATAEAAGNLVYKEYLFRMLKSVEKGKSMEKELTGKEYPLIPLIVVRILGVGEKTGKLDEALLYLADFFDEEVDDTANNLSTILEPILLVGLAVMVGFVAISVITPIYQLSGGVH